MRWYLFQGRICRGTPDAREQICVIRGTRHPESTALTIVAGFNSGIPFQYSGVICNTCGAQWVLEWAGEKCPSCGERNFNYFMADHLGEGRTREDG